MVDESSRVMREGASCVRVPGSETALPGGHLFAVEVPSTPNSRGFTCLSRRHRAEPACLRSRYAVGRDPRPRGPAALLHRDGKGPSRAQLD